MKVFAYCAASFEKSVHKAAGVQPLLSPPMDYASFFPEQLEGYDLLYFKLHGLPGQPFWYGDHWETALTDDQVLQADLTGTTIFVANCHLYKGEPGHYQPSPMLTALLKSGARAVVGGPGTNYAKKHTLHGADILGHAFRIFIGLGFQPSTAYHLARARLRFQLKKNHAAVDTLAFRIFDNKTSREQEMIV